jgi:hypothetical protein
MRQKVALLVMLAVLAVLPACGSATQTAGSPSAPPTAEPAAQLSALPSAAQSSQSSVQSSAQPSPTPSWLEVVDGTWAIDDPTVANVTMYISRLANGRFQAAVSGGAGAWTEQLAPAASPGGVLLSVDGTGSAGPNGSPDKLVIQNADRVEFTFTDQANGDIDIATFSRTN